MSDEKEILKKILNDWSERGEIIKCIDGCYFPDTQKSPHQQFPVPSELLDMYMKSLLETLSAFHEYAEDNNILYSLLAGTLIGYYWNGGIIPWDDDIDIVVSESSFHEIKDNLWQTGYIPKKIRKFRGFWDASKTRIVELGGDKYEIGLNAGRHSEHRAPWRRCIKLIPLGDFSKSKTGGIDIVQCNVLSDGKLTESWKKNRICFGPTDDSLPKDYPVVTFSGIETRAVTRELGEPYLDQVYGQAWRIPCTPKMKHGYKFGE
jgi:hypothetical protein